MSCEPMFEICSPRSVGELLRLRHRGDQLVHAHLARRVAGLHVAGAGAGDGAARGEHDDVGQVLACLGVSATGRIDDRRNQRDAREEQA